MTSAEIRSYELAYQIRCYLDSHKMPMEHFAQIADVPLLGLTLFMRDGVPEPAVSQITRICDVLSISMDSLVHGPVKEKGFIQLVRKCVFANKLEGTPFYALYICYLKRWQEKKIKFPCLKRYTKWFMYFCTMKEDEKQPCNDPASFQLSSSVCFTRKISSKQKQKLEQIIEDSKKK